MEVDKMIEVYIKIRDAIADKKAEQKKELEALEGQLEVLGQELNKICEEVGGSITTPAGRVSRKITRNYWTNNWEALYAIIKEHDAFHLLRQQITNSAMKEFLEANPDIHPEGLNVDSKYTVTVYRK